MAFLKTLYPAPSGIKVEFNPKCTIVGGEEELMDFLKGFKLILFITQELMQSFKIVALLLLNDSGGYVQFTLKFIIVGGVGMGGLIDFFKF